jgi:membrane-associated HD superfamily phosphohydrolase
MALSLKSYEVDFEHGRITVRPVKGPEKQINRTYLEEKLRADAEKHVDKNVDVKKEVTAETSTRLDHLRRVLAGLKGDSMDAMMVRDEIQNLEGQNLDKAIVRRRNQLVSETAREMAKSRLEDLLTELSPKALIDGSI